MFSTTIYWPSSSDMRAASRRPTMSTLLPGPNGTIAVRYRVGHSWADAAPDSDSVITADASRRHKRIGWLPRLLLVRFSAPPAITQGQDSSKFRAGFAPVLSDVWSLRGPRP